MKVNFDRETDALYLRLDEAEIVDSEQVAPGVIVDFDSEDRVVGLEVLALSKRAAGANARKDRRDFIGQFATQKTSAMAVGQRYTATMPTKKSSGKRTTIKPKGDARYIRRDSKGRIKESDDVGRSLKKDREKKAKTTVRSGYGDRGDQKRS
jgi:uncharacterized protein YuzE